MIGCALLIGAALVARADVEIGDNLCGMRFSEKEVERVVFLGDSITHHGRYMRLISDYCLTRWPERKFEFRSAGVGGDTSAGCRGRLAEDVDAWRPTTITVMFGMNDVDLGSYGEGKPTEPQDRAIAAYGTNLRSLLDTLQKSNPQAKLILLTPSPFDDTSKMKGGMHAPGANEKGLTALAEVVRTVGRERGLPVVDIHAPMAAYNKERQKTDPAFTLCGKDRVHPLLPGGCFMAFQFLRARGVPSLVADIRIDAAGGRDGGSANAEVGDVVASADGVAFTAREKALPFPVPAEAASLAEKIGLRDFNAERLTVAGLSAGDYRLFCDGRDLGGFSAADFAAGVDLAAIPAAPGRVQAQAVEDLNGKRCEFEADRLRTMACVRWYLRGQKIDPDDHAAVKDYYDRTVAPKPNKHYYESVMGAYVTDWPKRAELLAEVDKMARELDNLRQPKPHRWQVRRADTLRTVDLIDVTSPLAHPHAHGDARIVRTVMQEDGVEFLRLTVTPAPRGWTGYRFPVSVPAGTSFLSFKSRAEGEKPCGVGLTLSDSAGQNYQYSFSIPNGKAWGEARVDLSAKPRNSWKNGGGKADGTIHFPILQVSLERAERAVIDVAGYRAVTTAGRDLLPDFALVAVPSKAHGLFYPADVPGYALAVRSRCEGAALPSEIRWTLTDFWKGEDLASGVWKAGDGPLAFGPDVLKRRFGSFRLSLAAGEGEGRVTRDVWFGRMAGADPEPCRWIGSIGGGSSWDLFRAMGIGTMNTSVGWNQCEPKKGVYVFPRGFDTSVTNMLAHGIRPHAMTHCPNPLYENPLDPEAFAKFAVAYAKHLRQLGVDGVEIWNEPRGPFARQYGRKDRAYVAKFVEFTRMARDAIKAEVPDMTVMVCAEDMPWDLEPMIAGGIARAGDAITFHPYCHEQPRPERSYFLCDNGRRIKDLAAKHGGATRFRISEFGWTTYTGKGEYLEIAGHYPRASYAHQAQYLVRNYIIARQSGVDYACQYRFDDMTRRNYTEHNFGFVFEDYTPKPSFCAVAFMARLLGKAEPAGALSTDLGRYRVSSFVRGGRTILACWAVEKPVEWTLPDDFGEVAKCFDLMGNEIKPPFAKDRTLRLTERPFYIIGEK